MANSQTDGLMARNEREYGLHRPVAVGRMEIGVAYAAGFSFDQNLARSGRGNVPFHEVQRFPKSLLRADRYMRNKIRISEEVFGKTAVLSVSHRTALNLLRNLIL